MEKGVYASIVGIMAIAVVILIVFTTQASLERKTASGYANAIMDVKRMWYNSYFVLDKKTTTGLYASDCQGDPTSEYAGALAEISDRSDPSNSGITCEADNVLDLGNGDTRLDLTCWKEAKQNTETVFYAEYTGTIEFKKTANGAGAPGCTITDEQSGLQEAP